MMDSSIPILWSLPEAMSANLGSVAPAALPISAVSSPRFRDMSTLSRMTTSMSISICPTP